jgi:hypothetical protein
MPLKKLLWISVGGVLGLSLLASLDWAPANASRLGQSVPTRTPTVIPPTPGSTPTLLAEPTAALSATLAADPASTPVAPPALLPEAGGSLLNGAPAVMLPGVLLLIAAWSYRRRARRGSGLAKSR